ncbi:MAG TPA: hypothetical protein VGC01_03600 [Mucilaginibacter sp.]
MKKLICMIALAAISYGTVFAAIPVKTTAVTDTVKKKKKVKDGKVKEKKKSKKDTTAMKSM